MSKFDRDATTHFFAVLYASDRDFISSSLSLTC